MNLKVPPVGPTICDIAFVGEAPGQTEVYGIPSAGIKPQPFIGKSGNLLTDLMNNAGILRSKCYLTNVLKERPSLYSNDLDPDFRTNNQNKVVHQSARLLNYIEELREELMLVKSNVIVAVGKLALWALCQRTEITKLRGSILESTLLPGRKVIPIIHPSATFNMFIWQYFIAMDMKRIKSDSTFPELDLPQRNIIMKPSFEASMAWLEDCHNYPAIGTDIEVLRNSLASYQAAKSPTEVMTIPLVAEGGDYLTPEQETAIMLAIARLHLNSKVAKIGQYFIFDMTFLYHFYGIITNNFEDTMMAHKIWRPDYPAGLDFITSIFTREPYYKDEGKKWFKLGGSWEQFWLYGGKDSCVTMEAFPKIKAALIKEENIDTYETQKKIIPSIMYMQERGIPVDLEGLKQDSEDSAAQIARIESDLNELAGRVVDWGSTKQLANYFYNEKGITPYRKRGKGGVQGSITTDHDALKRIARKGHKEAKLMLEHRQVSKMRSTYYEMPIDEDGRFRTLFNPVGTKFGRTSSEQTITDSGGNSKNLPPEFKKHLMCDEGYIGYELDLSQAENRIVAYIGPVQTMIDAFESGADVHSLTGALISGLTPEEVKRQDKEGIKCHLGGGVYSWRFWGKKANHGLNYDLGYKTFSYYYEIPEADGKFIVEKYHSVYPGVRNGYHRWVKEQLSRNRVLTNAYGRKVKFLGRWGNDLFADAYSFFPQSTVADKMNREGHIFLLENQDIFGLVEPLNEVYDSIWIQIPISAGFEYHADCLIRLRDSLETPITWKGRTFTVPTDCKMWLGFYNTMELKYKGVDDRKVLAQQIEEHYDELAFWHRRIALSKGEANGNES